MQVLANHSARKLVCMYVLSPNTGGLQSKWFHLLVTEENKCAGNKPFGLTSLVRVWRTARHYLRANGEHGGNGAGGGRPFTLLVPSFGWDLICDRRTVDGFAGHKKNGVGEASDDGACNLLTASVLHGQPVDSILQATQAITQLVGQLSVRSRRKKEKGKEKMTDYESTHGICVRIIPMNVYASFLGMCMRFLILLALLSTTTQFVSPFSHFEPGNEQPAATEQRVHIAASKYAYAGPRRRLFRRWNPPRASPAALRAQLVPRILLLLLES